MEPRFETLKEKKLIGRRINMSFSDNRTYELWKSFMHHRKEITNSVTNDLFSLQVYDKFFDFEIINQDAKFEKWAAIEVSDFETIPVGMESLKLTGGLYAVFLHKGPASTGIKTFRYIFEEWLPRSGYKLDDRPHFEILGEKYRNEGMDSEEEVWIPVKPKENPRSHM